MVRVGKPGDKGIIEIQDMMFTTEGNTAGVILMEWNVAQTSPGSAAMWGKRSKMIDICVLMSH